MKRNLLLLSASAAVCLAWPLVGFAEPHTEQSHPSEHQGQQAHSEPSHEAARPAARAAPSRERSEAPQHAAQNHPARTASHVAPSQTRAAAEGSHAGGHASAGGQSHAQAEHAQTAHAQTAHAQTAHAQNSRATSAASGGHSAQVMALRRNVQASQHFHGGAYQQPQGYSQRHWGYGEQLPGAYFARNYWIMDFSIYALFAPPSGLVWVRVGPDAMLIDQYTGEIIQVDYGLFY